MHCSKKRAAVAEESSASSIAMCQLPVPYHSTSALGGRVAARIPSFFFAKKGLPAMLLLEARKTSGVNDGVEAANIFRLCGMVDCYAKSLFVT